jgi:HAMP domain-containing protein
MHASEDDPASRIVGAAIVEYTQVYDELLAEELNELYLFAFAAAAGVLASGFFGLRLARQLAGRLEIVQGGVTVVAQGDYDVRLPVRGEDEIDRLSSGFNTMAQALKESRDRLVVYGRNLQDRCQKRADSAPAVPKNGGFRPGTN